MRFFLILLGVVGVSVAEQLERPGQRVPELKRPAKLGPKLREDPHLSANAIESARAEGCLEGMSGTFESTTKTISSCFAGGFVTETYVRHKCDGCESSVVVANVMNHCSEGPNKVRCVNKRHSDEHV